MEALFHMHSYNRDWLDDLYSYIKEPETYSQNEEQKKHGKSLRFRYQKAADEVQKIAVIGAFIVSDAVADDLMQLKKEREALDAKYSDDPSPIEAGEEEIKAIEDCIARVRDHAKEDLGITRKLPSIMKNRNGRAR